MSDRLDITVAAVPTKLNRAERNAATRRKLFEAAAKTVGLHGYAEASVARITAGAGVAQGTFYNHFANRQDLLDQLLPEIGKSMVDFIRARTRDDGREAEKESDRFRAFFAFVEEVPAFLRILNEAEFFAPAGYQRHLDYVAGSYARLLRRARQKGEIRTFSDVEIEAIVHLLMGARGYLSRRYADGGPATLSSVIAAYEKLLSGGLFRTERWASTG